MGGMFCAWLVWEKKMAHAAGSGLACVVAALLFSLHVSILIMSFRRRREHGMLAHCLCCSVAFLPACTSLPPCLAAALSLHSSLCLPRTAAAAWHCMPGWRGNALLMSLPLGRRGGRGREEGTPPVMYVKEEAVTERPS